MKHYESAAPLGAGSLISGRRGGSRLKCLPWAALEDVLIALIPRLPHEDAMGARGALWGSAPCDICGMLGPGAAPQSFLGLGDVVCTTLLRVLWGFLPAHALCVMKYGKKSTGLCGSAWSHVHRGPC